MDKKCRKCLIYLLKIFYEIGVFAAIYFVLKAFAQTVN